MSNTRQVARSLTLLAVIVAVGCLSAKEEKPIPQNPKTGEIKKQSPAIATEGAVSNMGIGASGETNKIRGYRKYDRKSKLVAACMVAPDQTPHNTEDYAYNPDKPFKNVADDPRSTFSIDVDTASYSNMRRFITRGQLPPVDSVRIEELINYFTYNIPAPKGDAPFSVNTELAHCPWNSDNFLVRIALQAEKVKWENRKESNLVFLLDVSGSMHSSNKLPLVKKALNMLLETFDERDRVAIVVYAGATGLVLDSTTCDRKRHIITAINNLRAGGSTNGGAGIQLAYRIAQKHLIKDGNNRVILCTDGDFNVGVTDNGSLVRLIKKKAKSGVFLTVLGFGMGNYKDSRLEQLADKGNGNYGYIDNEREAKKMLVEQAGGTLITVAKDVKIQVEFNPLHVAEYRLVGYTNRILAHKDFNDDKKDAGEIGAGHAVTALYEIVPAGMQNKGGMDRLRYQENKKQNKFIYSDEVMMVKLRYKEPKGEISKLIEHPVMYESANTQLSSEGKFAAGVAMFAMVLRNSPSKGSSSFEAALNLATQGKGEDKTGYRAEFISLINKASNIQTPKPQPLVRK